MAKNNLRTSIQLILKDGKDELYNEKFIFRRLSKKGQKELEDFGEKLNDKIELESEKYKTDLEKYESDLALYSEDKENNKKPKKIEEPYSFKDSYDDIIKERVNKEVVVGDKASLYDLMDEWGCAYIYELIGDAVKNEQGKHS